MMRLLFVGDGERDAVTVPRLVERILLERTLDVTVKEETRHWARLHKEGWRKYGRKLKYALRQAQDAGTDGLVATVDADTEKERKKRVRLREMQEAREAERERLPGFPMALGEAVPHGEAWLLDDRLAVRETLGLSQDVHIPTVRKAKDAKKALHDLKSQSERAKEPELAVLAHIARRVIPKRCEHAKETGFRAFVDEVHDELGPLAAHAADE